MTTTILTQNPNPTGWEQTIYAFLAEKERRSGSRRTVESYSGMLYQSRLRQPPQAPRPGNCTRGFRLRPRHRPLR